MKVPPWGYANTNKQNSLNALKGGLFCLFVLGQKKPQQAKG
jgi:hypothetical protein